MAAGAPEYIDTVGNFAHQSYRGFRIPNQWSASHPSQIQSTGSQEKIRVHNARLLDPPPTLGEQGFQLVRAPTKLNLLDNEVVRRQYYKECKAIVKAVTGCEEVRGGSHEFRNGFGGLPSSHKRAARPTPNGSGGHYGMGIHSDMCASIEDNFRQMVPDERHFECLNLWRSTDPERNVAMMPLMVCDMRTVSPEDIVFGDGTITSNIKQYMKTVDQRIIYSPSQRWYYFPNMAPEEVLVFRQYDSRQEALNFRTVFHSAVADPTSAKDAPMRSSIEARFTAIYGKESEKAARVARFKAQIVSKYPDGRVSTWFHGPIENYKPPPAAKL